MGTKSSIEWTDYTWNPVVGCDRVSPGCDNCYAFALHDRRHAAYLAGKALPPQYAKPFSEVQLLPQRLGQPLHWAKPRRIFVNSLSDLFHDDVPDEYIERVFGVMAACPQHTFQVLTKRPGRMLRWFTAEIPLSSREEMVANWGAHHAGIVWDARGDDRWKYDAHLRPENLKARRPWPGWPLPNVWLGTSIESNVQRGRVYPLVKTPAAVRFLSLEPLLGPVDRVDLADIDWVILGGESGVGYRELDINWAREVRDRCVDAGVAFLFKQGSGPRSGMHRELDGRLWDQYPDGNPHSPNN